MTEALLGDSLTGLPNLIAMTDRLRQMPAEGGTMVLMDINGLKSINELHGMGAGDQVIRLLGELLAELCARLEHDNQVYRIGGDEFLLHLAGGGRRNVRGSMADLRRGLHQRLAGQRLPQTDFRYSVVHYPADGETLAALLPQLNRRLPDSPVIRTRSPSRWVEGQLGWFIDRLTESVDALRATHELAMTDPISGLPNHRAAERRIAELLQAHDASGAGFAVLFIDGDNLKPYNEHLGYDFGNEMIRALGRTLAEHLRDGDFVSRWLSGDEFLALLPGVNSQDAHQVGERLRHAVVAAFAGWEMPVTVSIGISACPEHGATTTELVGAATTASAMAKRMGKNRCVVWQQEVAATSL